MAQRGRRPEDRRVAAGRRPRLRQRLRRAPPARVRALCRAASSPAARSSDVDALGKALKDFFKKHKLPKRNVRVGVANNRIGVRTIELPGIADPKQVANAVRFRAQEVLPIPLEQAVLDFQVSPRSRTPEGLPRKKVLLVVAYRDLIDGYAQACKPAGVKLAGIDLEAFALLRALAPARRPRRPRARSGARSSPSRSARSARRSPSPTARPASSRASSTGVAPRSPARSRARSRSTSTRPSASSASSRSRAERSRGARRRSRPRRPARRSRVGLQGFGRELVSSLQFYQSQQGSLGIREVVLAGGTAQLRRPRRGASQQPDRRLGPRRRSRSRPSTSARASRASPEPALGRSDRSRDGRLMPDWNKEIKVSDLFGRARSRRSPRARGADGRGRRSDGRGRRGADGRGVAAPQPPPRSRAA